MRASLPFNRASDRFDVIFLRNVMLYFSQETRKTLLAGIHQTVDDLFGGDKTADFERVDPARAAADYARLTEEFKLADAAVVHASLDDTFTHNNELMSLRLIYLHMIEEYARHLGHADLLREQIDGATGE